MVDEVLSDFSQITPIDSAEIKDKIIFNAKRLSIQGRGSWDDGYFYFNGPGDLGGTIELFHKNLSKYPKGRYKNYEEAFKELLMHEIVHSEHYFRVTDNEPEDHSNYLETWESLANAGLTEMLEGWITNETKVYLKWRMCENSTKFSEPEVEKGLEDIRNFLSEVIPYAACNSKYKNFEEALRLKEELNEFLKSCKRMARRSGVVPKPSVYFTKMQKTGLEGLLDREHWKVSEAEEKCAGISEAIAKYVSVAWYSGFDEKQFRLRNENLQRRDDVPETNLEALKQIYCLHNRIYGVLEARGVPKENLQKETVKYIAPEIMGARNPKHLEMMCDLYSTHPKELLRQCDKI